MFCHVNEKLVVTRVYSNLPPWCGLLVISRTAEPVFVLEASAVRRASYLAVTEDVVLKGNCFFSLLQSVVSDWPERWKVGLFLPIFNKDD